MDLRWNFVTTGGAMSSTAVTPTSAGAHDWTHQGDGLYTLEIPASAGTINNDTEGFGWFSGKITGVLPFRGPVIGFRAAALNDALIDNAWSTTRGLAGTALPNAAADAAGGLTISDAGGLDLDSKLANTNEVTAARMATLTDWINGGRLDLLLDAIKAVTDLLPNGGALSSLATSAAQTTAQNDLDIITGANGVIIASGAQTFNITGNITGNLSGSVGSVSGHTPQTGDSFARIGALGAGLTALASQTSINSLNNISSAEVKTQARAALTEFGAIENP
jgi:hypothetical protein